MGSGAAARQAFRGGARLNTGAESRLGARSPCTLGLTPAASTTSHVPRGRPLGQRSRTGGPARVGSHGPLWAGRGWWAHTESPPVGRGAATESGFEPLRSLMLLPSPTPGARSSPPELSLPTRPRSCVTFPSPLPPPQAQRWGGRGREGVVTLMCCARVTTRWWALTPGVAWCSGLADSGLSGSGRRCVTCTASPPSFPGPAGTAELVGGGSRRACARREEGTRPTPALGLPGCVHGGVTPPVSILRGCVRARGQGGALPDGLCRTSPSRWLLSSSSRCLGSPLSWVRLGEATGLTGSTPSGLYLPPW